MRMTQFARPKLATRPSRALLRSLMTGSLLACLVLPGSALGGLSLIAAAQSVVPAAAPTPAIAAPRDVAYPGTIGLAIDAQDVGRGIISVHQTVPVAQAGNLTLLLPEWLPGNHAPRGPIEALAGLEIRANDKIIAWKRDPVNVFAFHLDVPAGARSIDVKFQYLSPNAGAQGRIVTTPEMANLQWNAMVLYPAGHYASRIPVRLAVTLPAGWNLAAALDGAQSNGNVTQFATTDLETLVDSPAFAGKYFRKIDLDPGGRVPFNLNLVGDKPSQIAATDAQIEAHRNLVKEAYKLFGPGHFDRYDFLLAMSKKMGGIGLEHHRSSENARGENYFTEWDKTAAGRDLLAHELTHSWNGKWRRPSDLWTPGFEVPMRDSLLWVYEGQTQFWGQILTARAGLWTKEQALDSLAATAALFDTRPGRKWRPVLDTTNDPIISARRPQPWRSWQRSEDYYSEGLLVWLDADQLIREKTGGKKSLDDFARAFFGGGKAGDRTPALYDFDTVVAHLNQVMAYDWATFLKSRIHDVQMRAPLDGLTRGGYRLIYSDTQSELAKSAEMRSKTTDFFYSLGFVVGENSQLSEVVWDSLAFQNGLVVGDTLIAVNGKTYSGDDLKDAIKAAKGSKEAIELLVKDGDNYRTIRFDYHDGLRYPKLERIEGTPDRLGDLLKPRR